MLAIVMPDLLADLLLLTFSGLDQPAPAIAAALLLRRRIHVASIICGIVVGLAVVIVFTFVSTAPLAINDGIIGLVANVIMVAAVEAVLRSRRRDRVAESVELPTF